MDLSCPALDRSHPDRPIRNLALLWTYLPDHDQTADLIWFQPHPCETLPDQPDHSCPISTVSVKYFHHSIPGWNAKSATIPRKYGIRESGLEHAIPEGFRNLSRFARSGFGGQNKGDRCRYADHPPPPPPDHRSRCGFGGPNAPPRSYVPISAPIRASKRRPDQVTTKITTHRPKFVTTLKAGPQNTQLKSLQALQCFDPYCLNIAKV